MNLFGLCVTLIGAFSFTNKVSVYAYNDNIIVIRAQSKVCEVSKNFLSIAIDTHFIFKRSLKELRHNVGFMNMLKGFKPAYLRIGGTAADLVTFDDKVVTSPSINVSQFSLLDTYSWDTEENICLKNKWDELKLSRDKWLSVNNLATEGGLNLLFDLNVLKRLPSGKWDPDNALSLIHFSQENNLFLDWQLGNEPNSFHHVFGKEVKPTQLAKDFDTLSKILSKFPLYRRSKIVGPDITAPRGPKKRQMSTLHYLDEFLSQAKNTIHAATWHQYYFNGRNATVEEFMDSSILDIFRKEIEDIKNVVIKNTNNTFPIWISETASAFGGGAPELSNRFVSGFMWLDKLGMAALHNISVVIRQSFIGNHYGLVDEKTLKPNAAFWISYVYKKIVGKIVLKLDTAFQNPSIRLYAHCAKDTKRKSVVIFGLNLSLSEFKGVIAFNNNTDANEKFSIEKYILTGVDGNVLSRGVQLNGNLLKLNSTQDLPDLQPFKLETNTVILPPQSLGFFVIKNLQDSACG